MTHRQRISVCGNPKIAEIVDDTYAIVQDDESSIEAVIRSIERRTRTTCCAGPRLDSWVPGGGTKTYQATFGRPSGEFGGYNVEGQVWIYV